MSPQIQGELAPAVEEDAVSPRGFWGTAAVAVLVIVASVFVADGLLHLWARGRAPLRSAPPPAAAAELGVVEQTLIRETRSGLDEKERQREALRHYGWVDPQHHVVKLPIERAMDLVVDQDFMRRAFAADGGT